MEINGLLMDLKDNVVTCVAEVSKGSEAINGGKKDAVLGI